ncbi:leucine-rich repeat domain-containing protein [Yeosuana marina]|uniref:leucine-rich repeat domain-containing protein n=1 Tax=Yeosuana marina TaxID=1565536 RepID=UPI0030C8D37C
MKTSLLLILSLLSLNFATSQVFDVDGVSYNITNTESKTVEVTTTCYTGNLTIPSTVDNSGNTYTVTAIGAYAFRLCPNIQAVTIPSTVTSIGIYAFANSELTAITIPDSVTYIGNYAFQYCASLSSITIPNSIDTIHSYTFGNSALTTVSIPDSVTSIEAKAFENCTKLTSFSIDIDTPLLINATVFDNVNLSSIDLIVPTGSESDYQIASVWKNFGSINGTTLAIKDSTLANIGVKVYPNPVNNMLFVKEDRANSLQNISIYNMQGKTIATSTENQIDVSSLQKGFYLAKIKNNQGETILKFIKD